MGKASGLSDGQISLLGLEGFDSPQLSESDRAVLKFAHETTKEVSASDEAIESLKKHFSTKEIVEITFVVAAANFIQRVGKNLGVELEAVPA